MELISQKMRKPAPELIGAKDERKAPEEMQLILQQCRATWQPSSVSCKRGVLRMFADHAASPMKGAYSTMMQNNEKNKTIRENGWSFALCFNNHIAQVFYIIMLKIAFLKRYPNAFKTFGGLLARACRYPLKLFFF